MYSVLQHIPEKNFRLVRYYGAYARRKKQVVKRFIQQSTIMKKNIEDFDSKREFYCPKCKEIMEIVLYSRKPPPKDKNKLTTWLEMKRLSWRRCLKGINLFSGNGNIWKAEAEVEKYKRLVGELYAEIDFLKKTTKKLQELKAEGERMRYLK